MSERFFDDFVPSCRFKRKLHDFHHAHDFRLFDERLFVAFRRLEELLIKADEIRLVTSWDTADEDIEAVITALSN